MTTQDSSATIHASAVLVGDRAVLIRGPSGSGKSRLAFELIVAGRSGIIPPAQLVGDDRVHLATKANALIVRPAPALAGLLEVRGLGLRKMAYVDQAVVGLVVDLEASDAERMPSATSLGTAVNGVKISRIPVARGSDPLILVVAALTTPSAEVL